MRHTIERKDLSARIDAVRDRVISGETGGNLVRELIELHREVFPPPPKYLWRYKLPRVCECCGKPLPIWDPT
jgi:hypothetical protein